jgi:hypothetical protein
MMGRTRAHGWPILLAVIAVAALVALIDLRDRHRHAGERADEYISQLFAGASGWALMTHPRLVTSWRVPGPAGHAVLPDRQSVDQLVALLHEGASYAHGTAANVHAYDVAVRFEDENGSLTLMFTRDGATLQVMRDGSPLSQADTTPVRERLRTLLLQVLGEAAAKSGR